jgi:hypothetical protein
MLGTNSFRKITTLFTLVAVWTVYSMVAFAMPRDSMAEITVSGPVTVNGQAALSNATILSGSSIVTPENSSAVVNMGKAGKIEVAPNSNLTLSFDAGAAHIDLIAGTVSVLKSAQGVSVSSDGTTHIVAAGESASVAAVKSVGANKNSKTVGGGPGGAWWLWALVIGGAAVGIIVASSRSNNFTLSSSGSVISPTR